MTHQLESECLWQDIPASVAAFKTEALKTPLGVQGALWSPLQ